MAIEIHVPDISLKVYDEEIDLEPLQGLWSESQYLRLTNYTNKLVEFTDGVIEVLPMPTRKHQKIVAYFYRKLFSLVEMLGGIVLFSPLRVHIRPGKFREPDLLMFLDEQDPRNQDEFWFGADLVLEVVSPDRPKRDTEEKVLDYAEASIPEYWIVNPLDETITVLVLEGDAYIEHGIFQRGEQATSRLLDGFAVDVGVVFDIA